MSKSRYTVHPIDEKTFAIEEKTPLNQGLCYLLLGSERTLLVDTGFGFKGFKETVESLTALPVTVANTHAHVDHIGGNHLFDEIWYHEDDKTSFALQTDVKYTTGLLAENIPQPLRFLLGVPLRRILKVECEGNYHYFKDGHVFDLGGRQVEVIATPGHSRGSVCFLDRSARQLFSGDTVCEWGILLHLVQESAPTEDFLASMRRLKALGEDYDTIWPGHHDFPVDKSIIDDYITCAEQILDGSAEMGITNGRLCAKYGRILITIPGEEKTYGRA